MTSAYLRGLKRALTGDPDVPLVLLCNFEVEQRWAPNYVGLPTPQLATGGALVRRMEELGAVLAGDGDTLCLGTALDPGFREYAAGLGLDPPEELVVGDAAGDEPGEELDTSRRLLASPAALDRLRELAAAGAYLLPMGVSADEEAIATAAGLPLAGADSRTTERVNGKIYSRRLVEEAGIRPVPGTCCESVADLEAVLGSGFDPADPVIVKEAYGVSGKGLLLVDTGRKADQLLRMVRRRAARTGTSALHLVVERFLAKRCDLNYQFTIDRRGRVTFDFVKEAITAGGVHQGHLMPARLSAGQEAELRATAETVGARLFADGFFGVVGVDAIVGADETLYPVLEINARLNMSSYQGALVERFHRPGGAVLARYYRLQLPRRINFADLRTVLGDLLVPARDGSLLVVCAFGPLVAQAHREPPFEGRLYTMLFAPDRAALDALDRRASAALDRLTTLEMAL